MREPYLSKTNPLRVRLKDRFVSVSIYLHAFLAVISCFIFSTSLFSQGVKRNIFSLPRPVKGLVKINDTTTLSVTGSQRACKSANLSLAVNSLQYQPYTRERLSSSVDGNKNVIPLHGDITYDFFYRSAIDTPFAGNNIQQHNVRANIQVLLAKKLPVLLQINTRQSNSPWFKNYTDLNLQFDGHAYNNAVKDELLNRISKQITTQYAETALLKELQDQEKLQAVRGNWLEDTRQLQGLVESRQVLERANELASKEAATAKDQFEKNDQLDTVKEKLVTLQEKLSPALAALHQQNSQGQLTGLVKTYAGEVVQGYLAKNAGYLQQRAADSINNQKEKAASFIEIYKAKEVQYKEGRENLDSLTEKYNTAKETIRQKKEAAKTIFTSGSKDEINDKVKEYGQDSSKIYKWYRQISSIEHFSVGRSMINYSELSAKNISVNGLQVVYSNKISMAFATGSVDYRYRDFIVSNYSPVKQYLNIARAGIGDKERNNFFLTVFQGKKQANVFTLNNQPAVNKLFGFALEGRFRINENNYLLAEAAKSNYPAVAVTGTVQPLITTPQRRLIFPTAATKLILCNCFRGSRKQIPVSMVSTNTLEETSSRSAYSM